jgi:WD40 repeat protein
MELFLITLLLSCTYKYKISVKPDDAVIVAGDILLKNNETFKTKSNKILISCKRRHYIDYKEAISNSNIFSSKNVNITMQKEKYNIRINTLEGSSEVFFNGSKIGTTPFSHDFEYGTYDLVLKKNNFADQTIRLEAKANCTINYSHKKDKILLKQVGVFDCGEQPKQVIYSPDDKYIFIPLLAGDGFQVFNNETYNMDYYIKPPDPKKCMGFPEGLFILEKNSFMVSQMTTGKIYEYSYPDLQYKRTIDSKGMWTKFLAWSHELQVVAASNWETNDISIINYNDGKVIKLIKTALSPRGLAFTKDGKYLYATAFDGGEIYKISTKEWKIEKKISKVNAAMRHIELTNDEKKAYVSNMHHSEIYEIDTDKFEILNIFKVDYNPNSIALTPDNRLLFVSCRGPNDPETYLTRSPRNGRNAIIDLTTKKIIGTIEGGNQPTGLDVSNDGNYVCFSNFRDNNIEIYYIGDFNK